MNAVERPDCSTLDATVTPAGQISRLTVEDAMCIQSSEGGSLESDLTTHLRAWNNWAGSATRFDMTPGSSFWGPQSGSNHGRNDATN